ncbi:MAG TPA: cyclopropane-fatty-acyl-phospholipid synthase family protein [Anaerolineaceae bacterium]|nr:cyclopropane-fatty-acyl-phospholipid synthase family protein [Anaerolineaceae bacterium]
MTLVTEPQTQGPARERTLNLVDKIFPPPRRFALRLWDGTEMPAAVPPAFTLVLRHPGALRRMFTPPIELSIGEAYIFKDFDIEGDLLAAVSLVDDLARSAAFAPGDVLSLLQSLRSLPDGRDQPRVSRRGPAALSGEVHSIERDRRAIQYHYDVGNDFYARWLDPYMQYSCAYFASPDEPLETAQRRKLEHICRKLRLKSGERLLDIGCGWGGLIRYAAEQYGVQALGVTLSEQQALYGQAEIERLGLQEQVQIELRDYRTLADQSFDKIVSVGMFEHVGRSHLPEYFNQAFRLLAPGGLFLNHGISRQATASDVPGWPGVKQASFPGQPAGLGRNLEKKIFGRDTFSQRYVFPDSEVVPVSAANLIAELAGFEVRDVEDLREHYALTLRHWVRRLGNNQADLIDLKGEEVYRTWRLFLSVSAHSFESGRIGIHQSLLAKQLDGVVPLPLTRADLYR